MDVQKLASVLDLTEEELAEVIEAGLEKVASEYDEELEKVAAAEYMEAVEKIANLTGLDAEALAKDILVYRDYLIKEAQIEAFCDSLTDEEVDEVFEVIKEAAAKDPEIAQLVAMVEEEQENEELLKVAMLVDELSDEEVEQILSEEEKKTKKKNE